MFYGTAGFSNLHGELRTTEYTNPSQPRTAGAQGEIVQVLLVRYMN